jgi:hypothetical protein
MLSQLSYSPIIAGTYRCAREARWRPYEGLFLNSRSGCRPDMGQRKRRDRPMQGVGDPRRGGSRLGLSSLLAPRPFPPFAGILLPIRAQRGPAAVQSAPTLVHWPASAEIG